MWVMSTYWEMFIPRDGQHAGEVSVVVLNEFGQEGKVVNYHMLLECCSDSKYNRVGGYSVIIHIYDNRQPVGGCLRMDCLLT